MKSIVFVLSLFTGTVLATGGGRDEICQAERDLWANIANGYGLCCQESPDDRSWGDRVQSAHVRNERLRWLISVARMPGMEKQIGIEKGESLRAFYDLLHGRLVEAIGPTGNKPGNSIANTFAILEPTDLISVALSAVLTDTNPAKAQPMLVNGDLYSSESAGVAIEAQTLMSVDGSAPSASILPVINTVADQYQFDSTGSLSVLTGPYEWTLGVAKGRLTVTELLSGDLSKLVPTDMVLTLQGDGITATLTLDETCPYNELVLDVNGDGYLGMAVSLSSESDALARVSQLGSFWMVLPVSQDAAGGLVFDTAGWSIGTEIFPIQPATMAIVMGETGASNDLPNGRDESCADADGNDIRDGADEILNLYDNLSDCD